MIEPSNDDIFQPDDDEEIQRMETIKGDLDRVFKKVKDDAKLKKNFHSGSQPIHEMFEMSDGDMDDFKGKNQEIEIARSKIRQAR